ncbi:PREDICTED: protein trichome birefringence-like 19 isoform X1 [Lupinus angustifolius]|uniref:protein trichome birefringence-like 19 isoform X1 n=1 Tax=Lupinus angustifolius TaxID=3871 RepID=UPI00092F250B|nr:PREDICTED: protein trichome birefringence-like 19 isoform X1 [Lupinus angustifolius]
MKSQYIELLYGNTILKQIPKVTILGFFVILIFTVTPLSYPMFGFSSILRIKESKKPLSSYVYDHFNNNNTNNNHDNEAAMFSSTSVEKCDIFTGEWVPNPKAPYYTNKTCWAIHEHQNCMKYGRADSEFMKWRWRPNDCDLQIFNPFQFLEIVKGKTMAFVGDSVGRNQMQSMICLLSRVEWPIDVSYTKDEHFKRWKYPSYNFTMSFFWTPHLIKAQVADSNGPTQTGLFNLYLDEFDEKWTTQIEGFDYIILNGGHWFFRPMVFYEKQKIVGCHFCQLQNVTDLTKFYGYRKAFRTAFKFINSLENFKGVTFLRTFAPSHFENGLWNQGGNCVRTKPFRSIETMLEGTNLELYMIQLEEFKIAEKEAIKKGMKLRLLDTTQAMLLRPDGHPSRYGHWAHENVTLYNDCVHWCLPGPIDTWSDFLLHMLKMEAISSTNRDKMLHLNTNS